VRVPLSWLRDFVEVPETAEQIATTMSVRGFAVEGIELAADGDPVLDFEILANRPDCMSVLGMAREVATAYQLPLRSPAAQPSTGGDAAQGGPGDLRLASLTVGADADLDVAIDAPTLCPRYAGAVADVTPGPSPDWIQARLLAAGVRPISNVVDVTNYVLLELGHPMHVFDHARLAGRRIVVRTAIAGETLRTLDGEERHLTPEMLLIADAKQGVALAGIMGGADSEVDDTTRTIVLESAYFNPLSVRRTSKALNLKTEASMRFERGTDPRLPVTAMERACALLEIIGAGRARGTLVDRYPTQIEAVTLRLRRAKLTGLLGAPIPDPDVRRILEGLGFILTDTVDGWSVIVPTRRVDARHEVDLIEEVARHHGYDRLPTTFPALDVAPPPVDPAITETRHLRTVLTAAGFSEAMTFGFVAKSAAARFADPGDLVPITNPLSETFAVLRPSALPGLLDAMSHNRRRQIRDVRLFEVGSCFSRGAGERRAVACAWTGTALPEHWSTRARDVDFFDIRGVVEQLGAALGLVLTLEPGGPTYLTPGRAVVVRLGASEVGLAGQVQPTIAAAHGLPDGDAVYVTQLWLDAGSRTADRHVRVRPLPRFPSVVRDISILVDETVAALALRETIRSAAPATLADSVEFDRYQGKGVPNGQVSLSLHLTFRASDRTLTDGEVNAAMDTIIGALVAAHQAVRR
jgi:phenylalanyl-tRNA synthetase beta chain